MMESVKFYSDVPSIFISYRTLPLYPATSIQLARGEGINFTNGVYETSDPNTIKALRDYIDRFYKGKADPRNANIVMNNPIWENEEVNRIDESEALEQYEENRQVKERKSKLMKEFHNLMKL